MYRRLLVMSILGLSQLRVALAQFSPGELSRAHEKLEGMTHCADCHEVGKEISGVKCLTCHTEIKKELDAKRGYHFVVSSSTCVSCHKDHLGKDARITVVDRSRFDHAKTGFALTGKHASKTCGDCHSAQYVKDHALAEAMRKGRETSLGLRAECNACHEDRHRGAFGPDCKSCHSTTAWKLVANFDHSRTKFVLAGKHISVPCSKCHTEAVPADEPRPAVLSTKSFADCTPCHASHHSARFSSQLCSSCHTPNDWREVRERAFNHDFTAFKLVGKHATLKCQQCHKKDPTAVKAQTFRIPHERCTDCHTDYHQGEFRQKFNNDCAQCHTEQEYSPSTFTLTKHEQSRFPLHGAHAAVPCAKCHTSATGDRQVFRFTGVRCESCHKDQHGGQFKSLMAQQSCAACHSTEEWKLPAFDHSKSSFALAGKHATVPCSGCHKPQKNGKAVVVQYRGVTTRCETCHTDPHARQFDVSGSTSCAACHTSAGWQQLVFDHNRQSTFQLTGAHIKVQCRACHKEERLGRNVGIRYKPMSAKCESCHTQSELKR